MGTFEKDRIFGEKYEKILSKRLGNNLWFGQSFKLVSYNEGDKYSVEKQLRGIDGDIQMENIPFDVKTRTYPFSSKGDLLFELYHWYPEGSSQYGRPRNKGWLYTSEAEMIIYVFENKSRTDLLPKGYIVKFPQVREWIKDHLDSLHKVTAHTEEKDGSGRIHHYTMNCLVKFNMFPEKTLFPFDPTKKLSEDFTLFDNIIEQMIHKEVSVPIAYSYRDVCDYEVDE
ncbi:MAG: hypothetical protein ACYDAP_00200 [Thermoplasmataceae archaeon]|jgi:hypothetical protein